MTMAGLDCGERWDAMLKGGGSILLHKRLRRAAFDGTRVISAFRKD